MLIRTDTSSLSKVFLNFNSLPFLSLKVSYFFACAVKGLKLVNCVQNSVGWHAYVCIGAFYCFMRKKF